MDFVKPARPPRPGRLRSEPEAPMETPKARFFSVQLEDVETKTESLTSDMATQFAHPEVAHCQTETDRYFQDSYTLVERPLTQECAVGTETVSLHDTSSSTVQFCDAETLMTPRTHHEKPSGPLEYGWRDADTATLTPAFSDMSVHASHDTREIASSPRFNPTIDALTSPRVVEMVENHTEMHSARDVAVSPLLTRVMRVSPLKATASISSPAVSAPASPAVVTFSTNNGSVLVRDGVIELPMESALSRLLYGAREDLHPFHAETNTSMPDSRIIENTSSQFPAEDTTAYGIPADIMRLRRDGERERNELIPTPAGDTSGLHATSVLSHSPLTAPLVPSKPVVITQEKPPLAPSSFQARLQRLQEARGLYPIPERPSQQLFSSIPSISPVVSPVASVSRTTTAPPTNTVMIPSSASQTGPLPSHTSPVATALRLHSPKLVPSSGMNAVEFMQQKRLQREHILSRPVTTPKPTIQQPTTTATFSFSEASSSAVPVESILLPENGSSHQTKTTPSETLSPTVDRPMALSDLRFAAPSTRPSIRNLLDLDPEPDVMPLIDPPAVEVDEEQDFWAQELKRRVTAELLVRHGAQVQVVRTGRIPGLTAGPHFCVIEGDSSDADAVNLMVGPVSIALNSCIVRADPLHADIFHVEQQGGVQVRLQVAEAKRDIWVRGLSRYAP